MESEHVFHNSVQHIDRMLYVIPQSLHLMLYKLQTLFLHIDIQ